MIILALSDGAKSSASFTRPTGTTAYSAGDVVGPAEAVLQFSNIANYAGRSIIISGATLEIDTNTVPTGMTSFKLHLYNAAPTAIAENAAFDLPEADRDKYIGNITISAPSDLGSTLWSQNDNLNFNAKLSDISMSVYGMLTTDAAHTPVSACVYKVTLYSVGV